MLADVEGGGGLVRQAEPEHVGDVYGPLAQASGGGHEIAMRHRKAVEEYARHRVRVGGRPLAHV